MNNTAELLGKLVSTEALGTIGKTAKVSKNDVQKVLTNALPMLIVGMKNNASTEEGAAALTKALSDHAADNTDDVAAFLKNADVEDGQKILAHILGDEQENVQKTIATRAGISKNKTKLILAIAAPLLLSLLGQSNDNSSSAGVGNLLGALLGGGNNGLGGILLNSLLGSGSNNNSLGGALLGSLLGGNQPQQQNTTPDLGTALLGSLLGGNNQSQQQNNTPDLGSALLGSILGSNSQPQQQDNTPDLGSALLGSILGGNEPQQQQQNNNLAGELVGTLLGNDNSSNSGLGGALLGALLGNRDNN